MTELTDDEFAVLAIASEGQSMLSIGRWEKSIEHLVQLGLMEQANKHNNFITPKGREALEEHSKKIDAGFAAAHRAFIENMRIEAAVLPAALLCINKHELALDWSYCPYCGVAV